MDRFGITPVLAGGAVVAVGLAAYFRLGRVGAPTPTEVESAPA
jgi:hypothetical protein